MDWRFWLCISMVIIGVVSSIIMGIWLGITLASHIPDGVEVHSVNGVLITIDKRD